MPSTTVRYIDALHHSAASQAALSARMAADSGIPTVPEDLLTQIAGDQAVISEVRSIPFSGQTASDVRTFIDAIGRYDALLRDAAAITTPYPRSGYSQKRDAIYAALNVRRGAGNQVRADLGLAPSTCRFNYP